MKKFLFIVILFVSLIPVSGFAQCGEDLLKQALKEIGDTQYMKDFPIELKQEQKGVKTGYVKFNVILNSNSQYRFSTINGSSNQEKVIMQLFDGENMVTSNFYEGQMLSGFDYVCRKTKVYNLVFSFRGGVEGCARAVLSLVKQFSDGEL